MPHLTIGKLAERTGVSTDTLRYYEKVELLEAGMRSASGYRLYPYEAVRVVRFIRGAKALQFTLAEIRALLRLSTADEQLYKKILKRTEDKIHAARSMIAELHEIKKAVSEMAEEPGVQRASLADHLRRHTRLLGIVVAGVLSCFADMLPEYACRSGEECVRMEAGEKREKYRVV